jgi:TonB family protein
MQMITFKNVCSTTFLFLSVFGYAQNREPADTNNRVIICESILYYPREAEAHGISGTVVVLFDIDSNCKIVNVRVEKGIGYGCDEAAMNALRKCKPIFTGVKRKCSTIFDLKQPFTFKKPDED